MDASELQEALFATVPATPFFATQKAAVEAAGFDAGEAFIKLPYERELPTELLQALMRARVEEYEMTGAGWNDR
ncbi:MAG: hypothetical protein ACLP8S_06255 [Solirubrobacteraceae bacterium]